MNGARIRTVTLIVEVEEPDGSIETHTVSGKPARGKRVEIHPHYVGGIVDRVPVLLDSTLVPVDGTPVHTITHSDAPRRELETLTIREITP